MGYCPVSQYAKPAAMTVMITVFQRPLHFRALVFIASPAMCRSSSGGIGASWLTRQFRKLHAAGEKWKT
ncbi:hypothetical protein FHT77_000455 [Rhizobium sp. BK181]|nr:hypothetical protein [Rhizobium sp. BK181]